MNKLENIRRSQNYKNTRKNEKESQILTQQKKDQNQQTRRKSKINPPAGQHWRARPKENQQ